MNIINGLKTFLLVGFCFSGCFLISCKDNTGEIGLELQDPNEKVAVFNDSSMQVNTYSIVRGDTISLDPYYFLLGYMNDPVLGKFENNFMTEIRYTKPVYETNPVVDSLFLYLSYSQSATTNTPYPSIYGDSTNRQHIAIYELRKDTALQNIEGMAISDDIINTFVDDTLKLTTFTFLPKKTDTILRIKLPVSLGERLLDTNFYNSNAEFQRNILRGFYLQANQTTGIGAITAFNFNSRNTALQLYYHDDSTESMTTKYGCDTYKCNIYKRSLSENISYLSLNETPNEQAEEEYVYLKNNNGLETIIQISGLQNWADSGFFAINKASLILEPAFINDEDSLLSPNTYFQLAKIDNISNNWSRSSLKEYGTTGAVRYVDSIGYEMNIRSTLFDAINNGEDKLNLVITTNQILNNSAATRTIFKGAKNSTKPLKLHITYTKFNVE